MSVAAFLFFLIFFKHEFKRTVHTYLPVTTATEQFSKPENLNKWFVPFNSSEKSEDNRIDTEAKTITSGNYQLKVFNQSLYSSILNFSKGKKNREFLFSAIPDTSSIGGTNIIMVYKNSYFNEWFAKDELVKKALNSFADLKEYIDDTKRMYGYEIKPVKVTDTLFLFKRITVPLVDKSKSVKEVFESLISYAAKYKLNYNGNRIFYSQKNGESITLFASIGIANDITIPESEEFEIKRMPYDKKLLEATFQGKYSEVSAVLDALKKFIDDNNLSTMGIPFEKFISDGVDFNDDQIVQMKVYYPIL